MDLLNYYESEESVMFARKTMEASTLPQYQDVVETLGKILETIPENLSYLEEKFSDRGTVNVRSEKNNSHADKELSVLRVMLAWAELTISVYIFSALE